MYERETERFLRDVYAVGRRANREVLLALLVMAFEDDDIRREFLSAVESVAGDVRLAKSASAPRPLPSPQLAERQPKRGGGHQAQTPDPLPEDDGIDIVEEIE
jgi:hypothetical protein